MTEALGVPLRRHTTDRLPILVDWLAEVLELLAEGKACEDVDHTHEVDVLLVWAQHSAIILLVETKMVVG